MKARISDDRGFRVAGVLVRATPTALLPARRSERVTDRTAGRRSPSPRPAPARTYVYIEAHKKGEKLQAGVSTANLFKVRVR